METQRALLLEDEPDHGLLVRFLLERGGLAVDEAESIAEARRLVVGKTPDVVVVDVPESEGIGAERCRQVRALPGLSDVPFVAVTATHGRAAREAYFAAGVDGLVGKPVVPWLLEYQVRALLRHGGPRGVEPLALLEQNRAWMAYLVHDLNNPLTVIGGGLHIAKAAGPLNARQAEALAAASLAHERLVRLVASLLDTERAAVGGGLRPERAVVSVAALLDEVRAILDPLAAPQQVALEVLVPGEVLWPLDRELLVRALVNLGDNALRHAPRGTSLALRALVTGDELRLSVADRGPGVPAPLRERIFEPAVQGEDARGRGAAGLGLAFCRLVAESHGGRAWAEPTPGGGATFVLSVPHAGP